MSDWNDRIGHPGTPFVAGEKTDLEPWERVARLESSDYILALWEPTSRHVWWSDVALAASLQKPIFSAFIDENLSIESGALLLTRTGTHFRECHSLPELALCGGAFWLHGQSCGSGYVHGFFLSQQLASLESPIEARLFVHLVGSLCEDTFCDIRPQHAIGKYRADFAIESNECLEAGLIRLVVEADGHDFHERTKEQAARDKKRDRELQQMGWKVLRFTGGEIWRDPGKCAQEVIEHIRSMGGCIE